MIGRYPINFDYGGKRDLSYAIGNSFHDSIARMISIHASHFVIIEKNVGYNIYGNAIMLESGSETNNIIKENLIILVR